MPDSSKLSRGSTRRLCVSGLFMALNIAGYSIGREFIYGTPDLFAAQAALMRHSISNKCREVLLPGRTSLRGYSETTANEMGKVGLMSKF